MLEEEAKKKGIDIDKLKREQLRLSKKVNKSDYMDFSALHTVAGIAEIIDEKNKEIFVGIVVLEVNGMGEIEKRWSKDKLKFPYIPGFRAYRELNVILSCFEKLEERPDVFFIKAHGTSHPRQFGLASHFGIATDSCVIGIADDPLKGMKIEGENIKQNNRVVAKYVKLVDYAKPVVVSIGNKISLKSATELAKKFSLGKYKHPYPLVAATKFIRKIVREIKLQNFPS